MSNTDRPWPERIAAGDADVRGAASALRDVVAAGDRRSEVAIRAFLFRQSAAHRGQLPTLLRLCEALGDLAPVREAIADLDLDAPLPPASLKALIGLLSAEERHADVARLAARAREAFPQDAQVLGAVVRAHDALGDAAAAQAEMERFFAPIEGWYAEAYRDHAPHVMAYYECGRLSAALPFVNYAPPAHVSGPVFSTDSGGYRYAVAKDGRRFAPGDDADRIGDAVLIGGSTAFGLGATSDATSLASRLSRRGRGFYNFGRPAYVLQQSTIQFLFAMRDLPPLNALTLLIGVNELATLALSPVYPKGLGAPFGWRGACAREAPALEATPSRYWPAGIGAHYADMRVATDAAAREALMEPVARMLFAWARLGDALGVAPTLALQPIASWIDRRPPEAERALFAAQDRSAPPENAVIRDVVAENGSWFAAAMADAARDASLAFVDLNAGFAASPARDAHLFVDYCHLTDAGQALAADLMWDAFGATWAEAGETAAVPAPEAAEPVAPPAPDSPEPAPKQEPAASRGLGRLWRKRRATPPSDGDNYPLW